MQPGALFIITSDPRVSPRPAEAIRIAAGVAAWRQVEVTVCLRDAAVLALGEFAGELVDGGNFTNYLPLLAEAGRPVYVQPSSPLLPAPGDAPVKFEEISDDRLAALAARSHCVLRF